uniref:EamA domain-containing protein n=1 Tax=Haptolina ericina TaxID=156174 RepID=A0A7S3EVF8_9EUKA
MLLAIPSVFDLIATCLMVFGLLHINASVWMLLRGGGIVFVALMKHYALKDRLKPSMWAGVSIIGVAVVLVGMSSGVGAKADESVEEDDGSAVMEAVFGVLITLAGTFVQSVQYTYEEKVMSGDVSAPPWLLIGMEGLTGTLLSTFVLYPICWAIPGSDHGSFEDPVNTFTKLSNSPPALFFAVTFGVLVFVLNSFSVLVTYMMSSVWHAILDNFRPITIWIVELMIFYCFTGGEYGEAWTDGSWLQLGGMVILLFGTAVYNGSIQLPGIPADDLISKSSLMASPALSRSPLITLNRGPTPLDTGGASPYVTRVKLDANPMLRGSDLEKPFLPK